MESYGIARCEWSLIDVQVCPRSKVVEFRSPASWATFPKLNRDKKEPYVS